MERPKLAFFIGFFPHLMGRLDPSNLNPKKLTLQPIFCCSLSCVYGLKIQTHVDGFMARHQPLLRLCSSWAIGWAWMLGGGWSHAADPAVDPAWLCAKPYPFRRARYVNCLLAGSTMVELHLRTQLHKNRIHRSTRH